ncbi:magnesium transporter NIPA-domain-containing protein [Kalaharituber pfeilii]|nr:magnesium transporter NIPA-domain-containing protein [Kalaharituber pfeilii]
MGGLDNVSPAVQISIGVIVGIVSTSVQSLGLTLQRKSHLLEDDRPAHLHRRPPHRRRMWQIGMSLFILSNILGSTVQITTLPLVILSPLQASGLVFNSICATLILAEPFTRLSLVGTVLVCIGAALIAAFGAMKEPAHSLDELLDLLSGNAFLAWVGIQALLVSGILISTKLSSILWLKSKHTPKMRMIRGVAYGCVSGILSADCLLLAKSAVELLVRTIVDRVNQFIRWQSWMILLGLITLALTQLYYLHRGLKLCSTSVLYPLVFCVYNIIAILDGLIYYKQASRLSVLHACLIALGTAILLSGVLALSWRLSEEAPGGAKQTAQSVLSPGIGFIEQSDEESACTNGESITEENLFLASSLSSSAGPTRPHPFRRRAMTEVEEIWGELEDDRRRSQDEEPANENCTATETTALLRGRSRSGSGRKPLGNKRTSYMQGSGRRTGARERLGLQEALGGWWQMGKWWGRGGRDGGSGSADDREDGSGEGDNT